MLPCAFCLLLVCRNNRVMKLLRMCVTRSFCSIFLFAKLSRLTIYEFIENKLLDASHLVCLNHGDFHAKIQQYWDLS